jgi:hypothetical protein
VEQEDDPAMFRHGTLLPEESEYAKALKETGVSYQEDAALLT